ncbi:MAG: hypothetical protein GY853_15025 [PVC group bacterium]|nr:hypothetical protein [PVC group bacterium]
MPLKQINTNIDDGCSDYDIELGYDLELEIWNSETGYKYFGFNQYNEILQCLNKWHFDIHNLIEKGEAIDINSLNNG